MLAHSTKLRLWYFLILRRKELDFVPHGSMFSTQLHCRYLHFRGDRQGMRTRAGWGECPTPDVIRRNWQTHLNGEIFNPYRSLTPLVTDRNPGGVRPSHVCIFNISGAYQ